MSFTDFTRTNNKSVIWGLLQEGGVFNDIPNSSFENVKRLFETSIYSMKPAFDLFFENNDEGDDDYDIKASEMIMNSNKSVIKNMIQELGQFKVNRVSNDNQNVQRPYVPQQVPTNTLSIAPRYNLSTKKPKIEEIYRSDDLQKSRMTEIEIRLKEKQEEMNNMLNNKKPNDIDFAYKKLDLFDTKLASSDMDKLLAEALSSRQRELDQVKLNNEPNGLNNNKNAEEWIKGAPTKPGNTNNEAKRPIENIASSSSLSEKVEDMSKKSVTFNEKENIKIRYENDLEVSNDVEESRDTFTNSNDGNLDTNIAVNSDDNDTGIELSILSKLKKNTFNHTRAMAKNEIVNTSNSLLYKPIPLDIIMNNDGDDGNDGNDGNDNNGIASNYKSLEYNPHTYMKSHVTREAGEYKKLEEKVIIIQNELEVIKTMQEKIIDILINGNIEHKIEHKIDNL
jgi:hypothetical protein